MQQRKKILFVFCLLAFLLALVNVAPVTAQTVTLGKLSGIIADDKGEPLPGASVEATSPNMMGKRTAVTSARGTYVFLELPIGVYKVTASMPNFKTVVRGDILITAGSSLIIDLTLPTGAIEETVTVTAASPVVDAKSSTLESKLERQMLDKLPTSRDAFYDLSLSTPGMFDAGGSSGWMPSPNAYGGAQNENVFLVNGVNTTNPRGANWGSMVRVNYNAVEEVRIVALGSKAEFGAYSGAAVDVVTKSGSNSFHGNLAFYSQVKTPSTNQPTSDASLGRSWLTLPAGHEFANISHKDWEGNFTLGGPIVRDKVWFYGGFDYIDTRTKIPLWPLLQGWFGRYIDAKISAEPAAKIRTWVAYHYEFNKMDNQNWGSWADPTVTYYGGSHVTSISSQFQFLPSSSVILTAKYLGFWTKDSQGIPDPAPGGPTWPAYVNWWKLGHYEVNGRFPWIEKMDSNRHTIQADASYYAEDFLGEHDIKFGAQYTMGHGNYLMGLFQGYTNYTYPQGYQYDISKLINYTWYAYTDGMRFRNDQVHLKPSLNVRIGRQLGFFLDDQWTPMKRLTVNFGIRWDNMRARYGNGLIYEVPATPNQINDPPPIERVRDATPWVFNFTNISPRIGFTYMLTSDAKTVARASFGRYYMPMTLENLRRFGPDMDPTITEQYLYKIPWDPFDTHNGTVAANGLVDASDVAYWTPRIRDLTPYAHNTLTTNQSWVLQTASNLKNQFTDEMTLNLEREIIKDFSISGSFIFRHTGHLQAQLPINRDSGLPWAYELKSFTTSKGVAVQLYSIVKQDYDGLGDGFTGHDVAWINTHNGYQVNNVGTYFGHKAKRDYTGLQLVLNKRYSNRWQALGSIVYSHSNGTAARTIHQDFNVEGMMITDDYWMSSLNNLVNNMVGPLPFTPRWEFKISGSYKIPVVEIDFGLRYRFHTGRPVWQIESFGNVAASWMGAIPDSMIVQPSSGGLSTNILSLSAKDPYYLPSQSVLDFRFEKAFKLGRYGSLSLVIDGFNLFNSGTVTNIIYQSWGFGQVQGLVSPPRKFRFSVYFQF
jgi:hypothetical protein